MTRCNECPSWTPLRPYPERIQAARELVFDTPLDAGIREIVITLIANGIETFESCEGGDGHAYAEPTVRFEGQHSEGLRAVAVAMENGLPVREIRREWEVRDETLHGPWWEMTFHPSIETDPLPRAMQEVDNIPPATR